MKIDAAVVLIGLTGCLWVWVVVSTLVVSLGR